MNLSSSFEQFCHTLFTKSKGTKNSNYQIQYLSVPQTTSIFFGRRGEQPEILFSYLRWDRLRILPRFLLKLLNAFVFRRKNTWNEIWVLVLMSGNFLPFITSDSLRTKQDGQMPGLHTSLSPSVSTVDIWSSSVNVQRRTVIIQNSSWLYTRLKFLHRLSIFTR